MAAITRRLSARAQRALLRHPRRLPHREFVPDPEQAGQDVASRREMRAFDQLEPSTRAAISQSAFGTAVADTMRDIIKYGPTDGVRKALDARGVFPCDVGVDGVLLEEVNVMEAAERKRLADEIEGRVKPRSTHVDVGPVFRLWR